MTEAVKGMLRFGFEELEFERIHAYCLTHNAGSIRVLEKTGFTREGYIRHGVRKGDRFLDVLLFGMIREDFAG
jgi:RimJ/RimL family protein N-acetyltransferase